MGNAYIWGRFAMRSMIGHSEYPRLVEEFYRKHIFIGAVVCGYSHFAFLADNNLTEVLNALLTTCMASTVDMAIIKNLLTSIPPGLVQPIQNCVHNWVYEEAKQEVPYITANCMIELTPKEMKHGQIITAYIEVTNQGDKKTFVTVYTSVKELYQSEKYLISFTPDKFTLNPKQTETIALKLECRKSATEQLKAIYSLLAQIELHGKKVKPINYFILCSVKPIRTTGGYFTFSNESKADLMRSMGSYVPIVIVRDHLDDYVIPTEPVIYQLQAVILFIDISGFTSLNERLQRLGSAGPEQVSRHLNSYFGKLIEVVNQHGGDVLKFAGDALICMFGDKRQAESLDILTMRATQCALEIQTDLSEYDSKEGFTLTLHVGIGAGKMYALYVGGMEDLWEFLVVGDPLLQLVTTVEQSKSGEVVVSKEAYELIKECVEAEPRGDNDFLIKQIRGEQVEKKPIEMPSAPIQLENILRCFIPRTVAIRLDSNQEQWLAELRRVTVLFVKLTSLVYEKDKPLAFNSIQEVFCYMQSGMIRQFLVDDKGTVLIAAFGVPPLSHEDDPIRGIKAALDIHSKLRAMGTENAIGVTTGSAFCGSVGSTKRQEYAMVGDIVNLSARLMGVAEKQAFGVLCDEATFEASSNHPASRGIVFDFFEPVFVKGKANAVSIYHPRESTLPASESGGNMSARNKNCGSTLRKVVGRSAEKKEIQGMLQNLMQNKQGTILVIEGAAGMGKTLFVNLIRDTILDLQAGNAGFYVQMMLTSALMIEGTGDSFEKNTPLFAWKTLIQQLFEVRHVSEKIVTRIKEMFNTSIFTSGSEVNWNEYLPLLNNIFPMLGLPENNATRRLTMQQRVVQIRSFIKQLLQIKAKQRPLIIALDNLQWVDSATLQLAYEVAKEVQPIIFVMTTRPLTNSPEYQTICTLPGARVIKLAPLTEDEEITMFCNRYNVTEYPADELRNMLKHANGNPLFAEEIVSGLIESGLLVTDEGKCTIAKGGKFTIPSTINGVISSRIDRLEPSLQMVLKVASVVGVEFDRKILKAVYPLERDKNRLRIYLDTLVKEDFLKHTRKRVYSFKNTITQTIAYDRLLFRQRQKIHHDVAVYLENRYKLDLTSVFSLLAHHWAKSLENSDECNIDNISKTINYMKKAADNAAANMAQQEALDWIEKGTKLLETVPEFEGKAKLRRSFQLQMSGIKMNTLKTNREIGLKGHLMFDK